MTSPVPDPLREASPAEMPGGIWTQTARRAGQRWMFVNAWAARFCLAGLASAGVGALLQAARWLGVLGEGPMGRVAPTGLLLAGLGALGVSVTLLFWRNAIMARINREMSDPLARFFQR